MTALCEMRLSLLQKCKDTFLAILRRRSPRNLATFEVDLSVTEKLSEQVPEEIVLVSESGIRTAEDLARIKACGVGAVLIGEALMRGQSGLLERNGETNSE